MSSPAGEQSGGAGRVPWRPVLFLLAILLLLGVSHFLPLARYLRAFADLVRGAGFFGVLLFAATYVAAGVLMLPAALLTLMAGFLYGPVVGLLVVAPSATAAAVLAFLLGRTAARDAVASKVAANQRFLAIDRAVARQGFKIVFLLRLSPLFPFNLLNYALGLTDVKLGRYALASFLGMLPGTFLYVYLGSLLENAQVLAKPGAAIGSSTSGRILYYGGLLATVAVTLLITRTARRALQSEVPDEEGAPQESEGREGL